MTAAKRRASKGFTLLEVLVVLVIVSLISVVLMQGMGLVLTLRDNFGDRMIDLDRLLLKRSLVRHPLEGVVPDFTDGEHIFNGTPERVSSLTMQPLVRRPGRATPFSLTIAYDERDRTNRLLYQEAEDEPLEIARWEGLPARFRYMGDESGIVEEWPKKMELDFSPNQITELQPPQLPTFILLDTQSEQEIDYAVAIGARRTRVPRTPPMFGSAPPG